MTTELVDLPLRHMQGTYMPGWAWSNTDNTSFLKGLEKDTELVAVILDYFRNVVELYQCKLSDEETLIYVKGTDTYENIGDDKILYAVRLLKRKLQGVLDLDVVELSVWRGDSSKVSSIHGHVFAGFVLPTYKNILSDASPYSSAFGYWCSRIAISSNRPRLVYTLELPDICEKTPFEIIDFKRYSKSNVSRGHDLLNSRCRYLFVQNFLPGDYYDD